MTETFTRNSDGKRFKAVCSFGAGEYSIVPMPEEAAESLEDRLDRIEALEKRVAELEKPTKTFGWLKHD